MAGEPNPFHDPEVSSYLDEQNKRIRELEQALRRARLAIKAAMRLPPYQGLLEQALAGINEVLPEHEPEPGPPRMD